MSPGGAKPLTSPVPLTFLPTSASAVPPSRSANSSSYSAPCTTPVTHQATWSWIVVCCPGRHTSAQTENDPSGSVCRVWQTYPSALPSRSVAVRISGAGQVHPKLAGDQLGRLLPVGVLSGRTAYRGHQTGGTAGPYCACLDQRCLPGRNQKEIKTMGKA